LGIAKVLEETIASSPHTGIDRAGQSRQAITFHQYMTICLYHPEFGYYRSGAARVGREGDFYTSAYVGDAMGERLAVFFAKLASERFGESNPVQVYDWGGGTGRLGRQLLDTWSKLTDSRFKLEVVDGNPAHLLEASKELVSYMNEGRARVVASEQAFKELREESPAIILANELLDAFPVHRLMKKGGRLWEEGVSLDLHSGRFESCLLPPTSLRLSEFEREEGLSLLEGQIVEVNLDGTEWVRSLGEAAREAVLVIVDYGDETAELTAPHRLEGTLLCYARHRAHGDPFANPGEQDITSHVDFGLLRKEARKAGWEEIWYGTQKRFLIEAGILDALSEHRIADPFHPVVKRNRAIRQLLLSDGMSELFKVQVFVRQP
jgi:SAM-dependent MidA family methyltransferase